VTADEKIPLGRGHFVDGFDPQIQRAAVRALRRAVPDGDCQVLTRNLDSRGWPTISIRRGGSLPRVRFRARRVIAAVIGRRIIAPEQECWSTCGVKGCIRPEHIKVST
jgi:hypothetical protein